MLKRILVGLGDGGYTASALGHAVALGKSHDAELTAVGVIDERRLSAVGPVPLGAGRYAHDIVQTRLRQAAGRLAATIAEFTDACVSAGVRHRVLAEDGEPFSVMIEQARYHDLMVFGLRTLFELDFVKEPHDELVRLVQSGVRPLLAVTREQRPVEKVLIAYSGSMESANAMKQFVQLGLWEKLRLRIVSFQDGRHDPRQLVADAAAYASLHGFEPETDAVDARPKENLLPYADAWGADLIVIGNSAESLLRRRIFGETALEAIRNAQQTLFLAQ
jgi:nucleotide-binding universal stress UspA family protein